MKELRKGAYCAVASALLMLLQIETAGAIPTVSVTTTDGLYNNLGIGVLDVGLTGAQVYDYHSNTTSGYPIFGTLSNTAILGFSQFNDTTSFITIFDARNDGRGGRANYTLTGGAGGVIEVIDDPNGLSNPREGFKNPANGQIANAPGEIISGDVAEANFVWSPCCTDGAVIGYNQDTLPTRLGFSLTPDTNGSIANSFIGITRILVLSQFANGAYEFLDISSVLRGGSVFFDFGCSAGGCGGGGGGGHPVPEPGTLILSVSGLAALLSRKRQSSC